MDMKNCKNIIPYLFFGICTTLVNIVVYWVAAHPLGLTVMFSTIIAWVIAVIFAYGTNRKWVFCSQVKGFKAISKEIISFFVCRVVTGIVDMLCMYIFVDVLALHDVVVKTIANVLVIILNYVASRLVVFRRRKTIDEKQ